VQAGKITPDACRAFVRQHRVRFTDAEWQQIQFAAVAHGYRAGWATGRPNAQARVN
jgi:hypothetical protein